MTSERMRVIDAADIYLDDRHGAPLLVGSLHAAAFIATVPSTATTLL